MAARSDAAQDRDVDAPTLAERLAATRAVRDARARAFLHGDEAAYHAGFDAALAAVAAVARPAPAAAESTVRSLAS